ncbi:hypothetical protein A8F94_05470 [Bacillus sp. FJAT-27225]|uniref:recombinase family protein n=1 Tax=Bacillus sp. FJAT-27225 TaxID=1743144 RepID=UPI00080C238C|nr:recombinase family protein [Bacillus sp. FJAT-27225]OCA91310.1 hypothetical protein A8F94_05470 [Bacillus sp. FJAT-27225]
MKQTAAYYRSSTKLQEDSVPAQQYNINQFALKKGILIDVEFPEPFVSARKNKLTERPQMSQLMTEIRKGKIGRLIVYKRDRLARKVEEHLELYNLFKRYNVEVLFIAENEPPMRFDVFGELIELFIGVMNQRDGEQINMRIMDTKLSNFLSGKTIGYVPYGYSTNKEKTKILRNENELVTVKSIFSEWNTDKYKNFQKLAEKLTTDGIKRGEKNWTRNEVSEVLANPIYMGLRIAMFHNQPAQKSVDDLAIISKEDFELAQNLINKRRKPQKTKEHFDYLLSDLLFCEYCDAEILAEKEKTGEIKLQMPLITSQRVKDKKPYPTYECKNHNVVIVTQEIEHEVYLRCQEFFSELLKKGFDKLYSNQLRKNIKEITKLKTQMERELLSVEEKLVQVTNKWLEKNSNIHRERVLEYSRRMKAIKQEIIELESKKELFIDVPNLIKEIREYILKDALWSTLSFSKRQELIQDLVHHIVISKYTTRIIFKHPFLETNEVKS